MTLKQTMVIVLTMSGASHGNSKHDSGASAVAAVAAQMTVVVPSRYAPTTTTTTTAGNHVNSHATCSGRSHFMVPAKVHGPVQAVEESAIQKCFIGPY